MSEFLLKLYVSGKTPRSERAIANLRRVCEEKLQGNYDLIVVDVLEQPHLAEVANIMATPTLIRELPAPFRRIIGDLSNGESILVGLELEPRGEAAQETPAP